MDPPLINEGSFSNANPTLAEIWPPVVVRGCGGGGGGSGSTVTEQSGIGGGGGKRRRAAVSECGIGMRETNGRRIKLSGCKDENGVSSAGGKSSAGYDKPAEKSNQKLDQLKDYIHVRARRGQATDSHSLAERARREKISGRMKILQDLVPGCNKIIGKALVLDEIINYIQSLQWQVEFLSMKLEAVVDSGNPQDFNGFVTKETSQPTFDTTGMLFGPQEARDYVPASRPECLHMQLEGGFERTVIDIIADLAKAAGS